MTTTQTINKNGYSDRWYDLGTVHIYISQNFQFSSRVTIIDFDTVINKSPAAQIYNADRHHAFTFYNTDLMKKIIKASDTSLVILTSPRYEPLSLDIIKRKIAFLELKSIPVICIASTAADCFMKPHTGMWRLLNAYYKNQSNLIQSTDVIGMTAAKKSKEGADDQTFSNIDAAFASNIGATYYSVTRYLEDRADERFTWSNSVIAPEIRMLYCDELDKCERIDVLKEFIGMQGDVRVLMINGAPCSGKTTLTNELVSRWNKNTVSKFNELLVLTGPANDKKLKTIKKTVQDRIHIILDGDCETDRQRAAYVTAARSTGLNVEFLVVEVVVGIEMSKVFNHVRVEESKTMVKLVNKNSFHIYNAKVCRRSDLKYLTYYPRIDRRPAVVSFHYC
jgi:hypothetical protein